MGQTQHQRQLHSPRSDRDRRAEGLQLIPPSVDEDGVAVPRLELPPNPEDVANLVLFLASAESDGITGELIPIRTWLKTERFWQ